MEKETKIGILGLGYVGLPLSLAFASKYNVIGYDINSYRVEQLKKFIDSTNEIEFSYFETKYPLCFTNNLKDIQKCNVFIITVPTPLSQNKEPDLSFLKKASIPPEDSE